MPSSSSSAQTANNYTENSLTWKVNSHLVKQEICRLLQKPKVYYDYRKNFITDLYSEKLIRCTL